MEVGIIGGGIAGLSTAYWLVQQGITPTLIDAAQPGQGATWAAAGMLAPAHELEFAETALLQLGLESKELYDGWAAHLPPFGFNKAGTLEVALAPNDVPFLERQFRFQQSQGLNVAWLKGGALQEMEPSLSAQVPAGIWAPDDWQVDNRLLVSSLVSYLKSKACVFIADTTIQRWARDGGRMLAAAGDGLAFRFDALVIATGAGIVVGNPNPEKVYPVKGQALAVAQPSPALLSTTVRIRSKTYGNAYAVPKPDRIVLGSTAEEMGTDTRLTAGGLLDILRKTYAAIPGLYEMPVVETWVGARPSTLSRVPFVMQDPGCAQVIHVNGLYRHGILLGPWVGRRAAELVAATW